MNYEVSLTNLAILVNESTNNQYNKGAVVEQTSTKNQSNKNGIDAEAKVIKDRGFHCVEASTELMYNRKNNRQLKAILGAVSTAIWELKMRSVFRTYLPGSVTDEQINLYFQDITAIRIDFEWGSEKRRCAIKAHRVIYYYFLAVAVLQVILVAVMLQINFYLRDTQNPFEFSDEIHILNEAGI